LFCVMNKTADAVPGEILREDFLLPRELPPYAVAPSGHVLRTRIKRLSHCETPITADTAPRTEHSPRLNGRLRREGAQTEASRVR